MSKNNTPSSNCLTEMWFYAPIFCVLVSSSLWLVPQLQVNTTLTTEVPGAACTLVL